MAAAEGFGIFCDQGFVYNFSLGGGGKNFVESKGWQRGYLHVIISVLNAHKVEEPELQSVNFEEELDIFKETNRKIRL